MLVMPLDFLVMTFLHVVADLVTLMAMYFAFKLYTETDKGWYWLSLLLSTFFLAAGQWMTIFLPILRGFGIVGVLIEVCDIVAALLFGLSCYGIYRTMKEVRKRVE
jgi:hypothetical protein